MERIRFMGKMLVASLFVLAFGPPSSKAAESDEGGFTMSSGALLGGANGTSGA